MGGTQRGRDMIAIVQRWRERLGRSVRLKLLAIALAPLLIALPLLLLALTAWTDFAYDRLLRTKVRADLAVARGYFGQVLAEVGAGTRGVAISHALHEALRAARARQSREPRRPLLDDPALLDGLERERARLGLDFLVLRPANDPLAAPAQATGTAARLVVWSPEQLGAHAPALVARAAIPLVPTRNAAPANRTIEERAMLMLASMPVPPDAPVPGLVLHGGLLLNHNLDLIDHINRIVYPEGALPFGSQGTATLFLDDVRISTNVRLFGDRRAIGTRVSQAVRDTVLEQGQTWLDRAFVVNDWYVSAYEPLHDASGRRIGMLYVGILEAPLRWVRMGVLLGTAALFAAVMAATAAWSLRWARALIQPVERMHATMQRIEEGDTMARVGPLPSQDELGMLAQHLDRLLDVIDDHTQRLRSWGETLDREVAERTRELRLAQQQLVKSEKLAAIGQLTASIAHEINNPIAVIQGNLDLIRETLGPAAEPVKTELALLDAQIERMRLIVTRLLQYARPTEFAGYVEPLTLSSVVDDCLVLVAHLLQQRQLVVTRDDRASVRAACNRQELQQVVINLLVNAIQASPAGGQLALKTGDWIENGLPVGAWLAVIDEGPGLDATVRERLFRPFFTTKPEGNGLGLWISLGLVERYGGRLEADNRPDRPGAIFRVWLYSEPHEPAPASANAGAPEEPL
jgi:two-component system NtrC family sensor kinase